MKYLLSAVIASVFFLSPETMYAAEKKKVCIDQKQKDGSMKQVCKEMKVHEKVEGTKVPEKSTAKK